MSVKRVRGCTGALTIARTRTPLREIARFGEIMGLALFLASPASAYITGTQIVIDGGATLGSAD